MFGFFLEKHKYTSVRRLETDIGVPANVVRLGGVFYFRVYCPKIKVTKFAVAFRPLAASSALSKARLRFALINPTTTRPFLLFRRCKSRVIGKPFPELPRFSASRLIIAHHVPDALLLQHFAAGWH